MVDDDEWNLPSAVAKKTDYTHELACYFLFMDFEGIHAYCLCLTNHHTVLGHRKIIYFP